MLFKEKFGPTIVGDGGGRGRGIEASWTRFALSGVEASNSG